MNIVYCVTWADGYRYIGVTTMERLRKRFQQHKDQSPPAIRDRLQQQTPGRLEIVHRCADRREAEAVEMISIRLNRSRLGSKLLNQHDHAGRYVARPPGYYDGRYFDPKRKKRCSSCDEIKFLKEMQYGWRKGKKVASSKCKLCFTAWSRLKNRFCYDSNLRGPAPMTGQQLYHGLYRWICEEGRQEEVGRGNYERLFAEWQEHEMA